MFARRTVNDGRGPSISGDSVNSSHSSSDGRLGTYQASIRGDKIVAQRITSTGSAVMVEVSLNGNFNSCAATVHHGQAGENKTYHGLRSGKELRLVSYSVTGSPSCSIQAGNAFGN